MTYYFTPVLSRTGAVHQQPRDEALHCSAHCVTQDFRHVIDLRGALDAPDATPSGSVRALDCDTLVLGIAHVERSATPATPPSPTPGGQPKTSPVPKK
jgi:hypothetical protein